MDHGRFFIASFLEDADRAWLRDLQRRLSVPPDRIRWVTPDKYHVTLEFVGPLDAAGRTLEALVARTRGLSAGFPVRCRAMEVTAFPSPARARVLVVTVTSDGRLESLVGRPDARPHLTLGRVRRGRVSLSPTPLDERTLVLPDAGLYRSTEGRYERIA